MNIFLILALAAGAVALVYALLLALKIGRAKDLLSERGDAKTKNREAYTISEIAELCGFSDVYYFSRLFKKLTGYSPDGWRKR